MPPFHFRRSLIYIPEQKILIISFELRAYFIIQAARTKMMFRNTHQVRRKMQISRLKFLPALDNINEISFLLIGVSVKVYEKRLLI